MSTPPTKAPESAADHASKSEATTLQTEPQGAPAGQDAKETDATDGPAGRAKVIIVRALASSFRRAGRTWTREPTRVAYNELTTEQVEALLAEPMLDVRVVEA
jgi:hypothetical protein